MDLENLFRNTFTTTTSSVINGITAWDSVRSATNESYNVFNNYIDSVGTIHWDRINSGHYTFPSRRLVIDDLVMDDIYEVNDRYRVERTHLNNESEDIYKITKKDIDDLLS